MAKTLGYQLYPLSWRGGISAMEQHLPRIAALGVDFVWLSPIYSSPHEDGGYDVSNYRAVTRRFGTMGDFDHFVQAAHDLGLKVIMDLILNHTSVRNKWFDLYPRCYCWSETNDTSWRNLFNDGPAWKYDEERGMYYLHLFHDTQADLNWFPDGKINQKLVDEFRSVVAFWMNQHQVDGFRLDMPQAINKDFSKAILGISDLLEGEKATEVINAVFHNKKAFLIMECFDPTFGDIVKYYTDNTPVDFVLNVLLKDEIDKGIIEFYNAVKKSALNPQFMMDLESHDSPRFPSRSVSPKDMYYFLFTSGAKGICLYQGQELGLENPSKGVLPDRLMLDLDAQTAMRAFEEENLDKLRPKSRANARVPIPLEEYTRQEQDKDSNLAQAKRWIKAWKNEP